MSAATTIPAVLAALVERFTLVAPSDVQVIYGSRSGLTLTRKHVLTVGTTVDFTSAPSAFGDLYAESHVDETYDVACAVEVSLQGETDQGAAVTRALAVFETVRVSLDVPDESLGVAGVQWARLAGRGRVLPGTTPDANRQGRTCAVAFTVNVMAAL